MPRERITDDEPEPASRVSGATSARGSWRRERMGSAGDSSGGLYFRPDPEEFFSSGSTLLDLVNGGRGWRENRVNNVVGDKQTGKTLLAIEACANYRRKYPTAPIRYVEAESGFDVGYARSIGLPTRGVTLPNEEDLTISTVEGMFQDLEKVIDRGERSLYVLDSLDALSDEAELLHTRKLLAKREKESEDEDNKPAKGTYGVAKAKQLSSLFRQLNSRLAGCKTTVLIISQTRDAIGVTFGRKQTRSGGKALDFYASQIVWLAHIGRLSKTVKGVKRPYGVTIRAQAEKSRSGAPFRTCDFPIYFSYGIEDVVSMVEWLIEVKRAREVFKSEDSAKTFLENLDRLSPEEYAGEHSVLQEAVRRVWDEIEQSFAPTRRKYT
jgi:recombination protein RecA